MIFTNLEFDFLSGDPEFDENDTRDPKDHALRLSPGVVYVPLPTGGYLFIWNMNQPRSAIMIEIISGWCQACFWICLKTIGVGCPASGDSNLVLKSGQWTGTANGVPSVK